MGQLATELKNQQKGKFLNDTKQNPRDHYKSMTLRSGRKVESSRQSEEKGKEVEVEAQIKVEKEGPKGVSKPKVFHF